jgi:uncharacterized protein
MIKVVLDTNIFISGIFWRGNYCSHIIDAWRSGKIILVSSIEIVQELIRTLRDFKIEMDKETMEMWRKMIIDNSTMVIPKKKLNIVKEDPDDDKFFEAALEGKADYIISQDKHILKVGEYRRIRTIHPQKFVKLL